MVKTKKKTKKKKEVEYIIPEQIHRNIILTASRRKTR